ncbi:MarR family winged helix-turn-helix transcriptional regulator [Amycolatopsis jiangsuensis]|uniref:DNA-binding MarR family transcriptional regulator n=1 Tax=Amycolatopsis jiangsuensis TaxID=1181879 RepID=A0A840IRU1_9PSEU|nr:MarR family transcriptional regulator [Amycolatopsis jiangsuensis]MBB4683942.1 DNA-binding MarR family transcriptional regulator [Amycolatopsis jiangsuensis]
MAQITEVTEDERVSKALSMRLLRVARLLETELRRELAAFGIELWEVELLGALVRSGAPYRLSAGQLLESMRLTSGGVTKRVAGLESKGLVRRDVNPGDRRQILVTLTEEGRRRAAEVFSTKTETETRLLATLPAAVRRGLNDDLRSLLLDWEGPR